MITNHDGDDGRRLGGAIGLGRGFEQDSGVVGARGGDSSGRSAPQLDVGQVFDVSKNGCSLDLEEQLFKRLTIRTCESRQFCLVAAEKRQATIDEPQFH